MVRQNCYKQQARTYSALADVLIFLIPCLLLDFYITLSSFSQVNQLSLNYVSKNHMPYSKGILILGLDHENKQFIWSLASSHGEQ